MAHVWRAADEALLERLEDEQLLARVWELAAPGAEPLHPRAAGLVRALRERSDAREAIAAAERGVAGPLLSYLSPASLEGWKPALLHHLALFHRARAEHLVARDAASSGDRAALDASLSRVVACWLALGAEKTYLATLAGDVIAGALPAHEVNRAVEGAALRGIDAVSAIAREGLDARTSGAARALAVLSRVGESIAIAGVDEALATRARARATGARADLVNALLAPRVLEVEELAAREWKTLEVTTVLERAADAWRWAGEEPEIEHFVVREVPRFAWELYRQRKWDEMRMMLRPIEPLSDSLARRVERDPEALAWAAQASQALVFRAELASTLDAQLHLAERGYKLCPSLRNARLVLADLLCARAERRLEGPALLRASDAVREASSDVERAAEIFPELGRLPAVRERIAKRVAR